MIITIDGPTASGKSTVAKELAKQLGYTYINSGLLFRAVAYVANAIHLDPTDSEFSEKLSNLFTDDLRYSYTPQDGTRVWYKDQEITFLLKTPLIDRLASQIALQAPVRDIILRFQQDLAQTQSVITDGRDCGTVVFPNANYKFYITADEVVRAQRWQHDQEQKGKPYSLEQSKQLIAERDTRDSERTIAPLTIPEDAMTVDTSTMSINEVIDMCLKVIQS